MNFDDLLNELSDSLNNVSEIKKDYENSPDYILGFYEAKFVHLNALNSGLNKIKELYEDGGSEFDEGNVFTLSRIIKSLENILYQNKIKLEKIHKDRNSLSCKMENTVINTERLVLKAVDESFASKALDYHVRNRDFLKRWEPVRGNDFETLEYHKKMLRNDMKNLKEGFGFRVWIFKKEDKNFNRIIGSIGLNNIVRGCFHSCHLGYKLDKDETEKGYTTEAIKAMIDFAFNELKLHRIEANVIPENIASRKVVEKLGFYDEGTAIKYLKINGKWQDHIHMVLRNKAME